MKKKFILFSVILFLLIALVIIVPSFTSKSSVTDESIEEAINKYSESIDYPIIVETIIEKVTIDKDTVLIFMLNENYTSVYYSIVKKQWNGNWMVENMSGTLTTKNHPAETNPYSYARIVSEDINGYYGVIFDSNVETIVLRSDTEEYATVIDSPNGNPIWYKVYQNSGENMENIEIRAIDSDGNEVSWSPVD